jgi:hypothetical protein
LPDTPVYKNNITNIKYKYLFSFGSTGVWTQYWQAGTLPLEPHTALVGFWIGSGVSVQPAWTMILLLMLPTQLKLQAYRLIGWDGGLTNFLLGLASNQPQ